MDRGFVGLDGGYEKFYSNMEDAIDRVRSMGNRPLTLTEKILAAHASDPDDVPHWVRGSSSIKLDVDRVAMQDATAQMALLQFMVSGLPKVAKPTTIHCDHLIQARDGVKVDLMRATEENVRVYAFLETAAAKFGIGFWKAGSGIIHQIVLENYAMPGLLMIGTDSHTPNASGLSMLAIGVGGLDAVAVMVGRPWEVLCPKLIGVRLIGKLRGWTEPKDIILKLCSTLTTKGGTNQIIEYFGPGVDALSATGRATICNMGAELGATTSIFPYDTCTRAYLCSTGRNEIADAADMHGRHLRADPEVLEDPDSYYDKVVTIDLDDLRPQVNGPHSPDRGRALADLAVEAGASAATEVWPLEVSACLVGSCTNSSDEDMYKVADIYKQARARGLKPRIPLGISPGSERVRTTLAREGILDLFEEMNCTVFANACGACIGQWQREGVEGKNSIISSFNRNFDGRNDGNKETLSFLASPVTVAVTSLVGKLGADPETLVLVGSDGESFKLKPPVVSDLVRKGLAECTAGFVPPPEDGSAVVLAISPTSKRLQILKRFPAWDGRDLIELPILAKALGKTTTDAISPAKTGDVDWLLYRGHLDNISNNLLLGARNAFTKEIGRTEDPITRKNTKPYAWIARSLQTAGYRWVIIADHNYGEGSSREHAAMSPRHLGCAAVIARSFARIHESNLKNQGILPLVFANQADYELFGQYDRVSIVGLADLREGEPVTVLIRKPEGLVSKIEVVHTFTEEQIEWWKAGSALNAWFPLPLPRLAA